MTDDGRSAAELWRIYLDRLVAFVPEAADVLNPPADETAIAELEATIGHRLPEAVKAGWRLHDGQKFHGYNGLLFGLWWLPVAAVRESWLRLQVNLPTHVEVDDTVHSWPAGAIQRTDRRPGWIPLWGWPDDGDVLGLDFEPGPTGRAGQVINFGGVDQSYKFVACDDADTLLRWMADQATAGRFVRKLCDYCDAADAAVCGVTDDLPGDLAELPCDCDCHSDEGARSDDKQIFLQHTDGMLIYALREAVAPRYDT